MSHSQQQRGPQMGSCGLKLCTLQKLKCVYCWSYKNKIQVESKHANHDNCFDVVSCENFYWPLFWTFRSASIKSSSASPSQVYVVAFLAWCSLVILSTILPILIMNVFKFISPPHWLQEEFDGREHIGNPKTPSCLCKSLTISQNAS